MGLRFNTREVSQLRLRAGGALWGSTSHAVLVLAAATLMSAPAFADVDPGQTVKISTISGNTTLAGGTLQFDTASTYSRDFTFKDSTSSTFDLFGKASTLTGKLTGKGNITFADSVGGGKITLQNSSNDYTGTTTINSGATVLLLDSDTNSTTNTTSGTIATSQRLINNGTFDISGTLGGTSLVSLAGSGQILLGSNSLVLNDYNSNDTSTVYPTNTTFSGVISGTGNVALTSGEITLTGVNTFTGSLTVSSDTIHIKDAGSIASASAVVVYGTLDFTNANEATIKSLSGSGTVTLGSKDLTITAASGVYYGTISTSGKLILTGGTQFISGGSTFGGGILISGGTLQIGSNSADISVAYKVVNNGTFAYNSNYAVTMTGVVSGTGSVIKYGTGVASISDIQTYTGSTTISSGTLKLVGLGSVAASSGVQADAVFDLTEAFSSTITSLSGVGTVRLGSNPLTITKGAGDFSGTVTGSGTITITGGNQSFSGINTYTGDTNVKSGGTLTLVVGGSLTSVVKMESGSTFAAATGSGSTGNVTITGLLGTGAVNLGGNTLVLSAAGHEFAGVISGTGGVWLASGGERLSGANTYTGTTTVATSGGLFLTGSLAATSKLAIDGLFDASGASGTNLSFAALTGSGSVKLGAHGLILTAASGAFSGVIDGTAGIEVAGGIQVLSGANTYTGTTTVDSGATLQIGNGASTGSITGGVVDNGTLRFYRLDTSTFAGQISGSGAVVQGGIGTTILTADSTYTGGTTITAGTLQIGAGGTTGSIQGNVVNDGTLAFARSDAVTIGAVISGGGNVTVASGTVKLTGASTYTGITKINAGAELDLTGSGAIASSSRVTANGTFDISASTASGLSVSSLSGSGAVKLGANTLTLTSGADTFSGVISGSGGLIVTGGTQVLSGTNTYTGATSVNGGTLSVTGSIANSALTVNSGGTVTGTGKVAALTVASNGTVKATNSGTLAASGNIVFQPGSKYQVDLSSSGTATSILTTTGSASVSGATLSITSADGTYNLGKPIAILKASGGITGTFTSSLTFTSPNNAAVFKSRISTTANEVDLTVGLYQLSPAIEAITAPTVNQRHVAAGIDAAIAKGSLDKLASSDAAKATAFESLGNDSNPVLSAATNQLAGEVGADLPLAVSAMFNPFLDALTERTAMLRPLAPGATRPFETWVSAYDGTSIVDGDEAGNGSHKFRTNVVGGVMGVQWSPWSNALFGAAIAGSQSTFRVAQNLGRGNATSFEAGVYGFIQASRHFYNSFSAGAGMTNLNTARGISVYTYDAALGSANVFTFGGRYEAGMQMRWFSPYVAVQDHISMLPSYTETPSSSAAAFQLNYDSRTYNSGRVEVGLRHYYDVEVTPRWILTPDFTIHLNDRLAFARDMSDGSQTGVSFAALSDSGFTTFGAKAKKNMVLGTLGADILFNNGVRVTTHVDTAFSEKSQAFTGFLGFGYTW